MTPVPVALGLFICDQVIVDQRTQCPTPVNLFNGLAVERFPTLPQRMSLFAALTDAEGSGTIDVSVVDLNSGERVYDQQYSITFPARRTIVYLDARIRRLSFLNPGHYQFLLRVDQDPIGQRLLSVYQGSPR